MNEKDKLIAKLIKEKGGSRKDYLKLLTSIAYHESAHSMDSTISQQGGGPGRGLYQFEEGKNAGGITAAKRTAQYFKENDMTVPEWLKKAASGDSLDATQLSAEQQDVLFLGNMRKHPKADLGKVVKGEETIKDFWLDYHWAGAAKDREKRGKSFEDSMGALKNSKIVPQEDLKKNVQPNQPLTPPEDTRMGITDYWKGTIGEFPSLVSPTAKKYTENLSQWDAYDNSVAEQNAKIQYQNKRKKASELNILEVPQAKVQESTSTYTPSIFLQNKKAMGGSLSPSLYSGDTNIYGTGDTHENNPNGGVRVGMGTNGKWNTVEQDEVSHNFEDGKYIFSNRLGLGGKITDREGMYASGGLVEDPSIDPPKDKKILTSTDLKAVLDRQVKKNEDAETPTSIQQGMYIDNKSKTARVLKEKEQYYNPEVEKNISSGDKRQDVLYQNQWLMNVPVVGDYIKNKAKDVAEKSDWNSVIENVDNLTDHKSFSGTNEEGTYKNKTTPLEQYFSKKQLLPSSKYKPTSDYLEFLPSYSVKSDDFKNINKLNEFMSAVFLGKEETTNSVNNHYDNNLKKEDLFKDSPDLSKSKKWEEFLKNKKPIYLDGNEYNQLASAVDVDFGGHKVGVAWDDKNNLPYFSISDAWDFEPNHYTKKWGNDFSVEGENQKKLYRDKAKIQATLLHKAGNPFKIYDRFYFDPKTRQYIPDSEIKKRSGKKKYTKK